MLGKTHARIAVAIAKKLNLRKEEGNLLEEGSIRPDSYVEFPHHRNKEDQILGSILDSRALFLNNDDEAFIKLGESCHFIADKWTLKPRNDIEHSKYESSIEFYNFKDDDQFSQKIANSNIPSKAKVYYEKLHAATKELLSCKDFSLKKALITDLVEKEKLDEKQSSFLFTYCDLTVFALKFVYTLPTGVAFSDFLPPEDFMPFPLISHIAWVTRENTDAEEYSTPAIDLNISLRLCLVASHFVLSRNDIMLPQQILDWNNLSLNWDEIIKENMENTIKQKEAQKKQ